MWYQSEFPNTRPEYWLTCMKNRNIICILQEMERVEAYFEDGSHHNNPDNIYVALNNQPSKLLQTVKY